MPTDLLFDYDSANLRPGATASLQKLGRLIQRNPQASLQSRRSHGLLRWRPIQHGSKPAPSRDRESMAGRKYEHRAGPSPDTGLRQDSPDRAGRSVCRRTATQSPRRDRNPDEKELIPPLLRPSMESAVTSQLRFAAFTRLSTKFYGQLRDANRMFLDQPRQFCWRRIQNQPTISLRRAHKP